MGVNLGSDCRTNIVSQNILYKNPTIISCNEVGDNYPLSRLYNKNPIDIFKTTDALSRAEIIISQPANFIGFINTNIQPSGTLGKLRIQASNVVDFSVIEDDAYMINEVDSNNFVTFCYYYNTTKYNYYKITFGSIEDPVFSAGQMFISENVYEFAQDILPNFKNYTIASYIDNVTRGGNIISSDKYNYQSIEFPFETFSAEQLQEMSSAAINGNGGYIILSLYGSSKPARFGVLRQSEGNSYYSTNQATFTFQESKY